MVQPTARVLMLLEILQAGGTRTIAELATRLDVDKRTVRRYVEHLRELDIPVDSVRGRYGGYRMGRHFRMPPLMLTDEEALAVVWALLATGSSGWGPASAAAVENATAKIRRVLPSALGRRIDAVREAVDFVYSAVDTTRARVQGDDGGVHVLLDIAEAARDLRPVAFDYAPRHGPEARREVYPHGVVAHRGLLYLAGHDVAREASRTFRLDRIRRLRQLDGSFEQPASQTPLQQVMGPLPPDPDRQDVSVLVEADSGHVRQFFPELLASVDPVDDIAGRGNWVRVFVRAEKLEWVAQRLAAVDRPFIVERPAELRGVIEGLAHRLLTAVSSDADRRRRSGP